MISAIFGFLTTLVAWCVSHLPASPFATLTFVDVGGFGSYSLQDILGWVNWLIPFRDMLLLFSVWATALLTASATLFVCRKLLAMGTGGGVVTEVRHLS